jgi:hypothetical protein
VPTLKDLKNILTGAEAEIEKDVEKLFGEAPAIAPEVVSIVESPQVQIPIFDVSKPYGQVDGIQGVKYQQDGAYFNNLRQFVRKE